MVIQAFKIPKADSTNYPEVVAFHKNIVLANYLLGCFFNCKVVTGHKIIDFYKRILLTLRARAERGFRIVVLVSCHGLMVSINFYRKVIFYMYKQYSNTFGLVKYIYVGNIQKRKVKFLFRFGEDQSLHCLLFCMLVLKHF